MVHVLGQQDLLHEKALHVELTATPVLPTVKAFRKVTPSRNLNYVPSKDPDNISEEVTLNHAWFQGSWRSVFWAEACPGFSWDFRSTALWELLCL